MTLSMREFVGEEFHAFCQQEYDASRRFLKTCGKPESEQDRLLVSMNKETADVFRGFLDIKHRK